MDYLVVRHAHMGFVYLSITLFVLRALLQFAGIDWRNWKVLRILPHVNDTLLLAAAIWLSVTSQQYPFVAGWLTAKVIGLLAYIGFGMLALRRNAPLRVRLPAFIAAIAAVAYVVLVATTRSPVLGLA